MRKIDKKLKEELLELYSGIDNRDSIRETLDKGANAKIVGDYFLHGFFAFPPHLKKYIYPAIKDITITLLEHGLDPNRGRPNKGKYKTTLGHVSVSYGFHDFCDMFIDFGLNPNIQDNDGFNIGHIVLSPKRYNREFNKEHLTLLNKLINVGLDVNAQNNWGYTCGHSAVNHLKDTRFYNDVMSLLDNAGLDRRITDYCGMCII